MTHHLRNSLLATALLSCGALVLVARGQPAAGSERAVKSARVRGAAPSGTSAGSAVLARFEGGTITVHEFQEAVANKAPLVRKQLASSDGREAFLRDLVRYELLLREAERRGFARNQVVMDTIANASIDQMILRDLTPTPASISAEDVARHFAEKRGRYARPVTRRAGHIQVATEAEARALIAELADGDAARFAHAAVEHSTDAHTHDQGGEIGYVARDGHRADGTVAAGVAPEVLAALFAAPRPGVLPAPVRHAAGFSVVRYEREIPALEPNLSAVEALMREELVSARQVQALDALAAKLHAEQKPVVNTALIDQVVLDSKAPDIPAGFPAAPDDPRAPTKIAEDDGV